MADNPALLCVYAHFRADLENARVHATHAEASLDSLPADGYGAFVRQAVARLRERLGPRTPT